MELKGIYTGTNGPIDLKKLLFRFINNNNYINVYFLYCAV